MRKHPNRLRQRISRTNIVLETSLSARHNDTVASLKLFSKTER